MGKPITLLERLCGHALSLGAESIEVQHKDGREWVWAAARMHFRPLELKLADKVIWKVPDVGATRYE